MKQLFALAVVSTFLSAPTRLLSADLVSTWNDIAARYLSQNGGNYYSDGMAMVHVAQFDAINAVQGGYIPYALEVVAPEASADAAASQAAYTVLTNISRADMTTLNNALKSALSAVPEGPSKDAGLEL